MLRLTRFSTHVGSKVLSYWGYRMIFESLPTKSPFDEPAHEFPRGLCGSSSNSAPLRQGAMPIARHKAFFLGSAGARLGLVFQAVFLKNRGTPQKNPMVDCHVLMQFLRACFRYIRINNHRIGLGTLTRAPPESVFLEKHD